MRGRHLPFVLAAFAGLFIVAPLLSFLVYGFFSVEENRIVYAPTLANFAELFSNASYRGTFLRTLRLAVEVAAINLVLGYAVAVFIWRRGRQLRFLLMIGLAIPLLMSYVIKIYAMRGVLGTNGALNAALQALGVIDTPIDAFLFNLAAVRVTLVIVLLPFMTLPIIVALERIPESLLLAAADLGASGPQVFARIVLPLSLPGAVVGAMFTLVLAAGDFLAPELVGGIQGFTYGRLVFSQFGLAFNWPLGAALSILLLVVALGVIFGARRLSTPRWQR